MGTFGSCDIACAVHRHRCVADAETRPAGQLLGSLIRHMPCFQAVSRAVGAHVIAMVLASGIALLVASVGRAASLGATRLPAVRLPVITRAAQDEPGLAPRAAPLATVDHRLAPAAPRTWRRAMARARQRARPLPPWKARVATRAFRFSAGRQSSYPVRLAGADFLDGTGRGAGAELVSPPGTLAPTGEAAFTGAGRPLSPARGGGFHRRSHPRAAQPRGRRFSSPRGGAFVSQGEALFISQGRRFSPPLARGAR
jgi:hypothetical protein